MTLKLDGKAEINGSLMFRFELEFAGVFRIQNVPQESLNAIVLIECPRLLFPFAREIIATTVRNGGFPPLLLDPVDFVGLYRQKMSEMQPAHRRSRAPSEADPADNPATSAFSPSVATNSRCAARSASLTRGASATSRSRRDRGAVARRAAARAALGEAELRLARADQLQIDLGQDLGVEQRAVLGAARIVDAVARAQIVEPVRPGRMLAARQQQRVDQPLARDRRTLDALELGDEKAVVEARHCGSPAARRR